MNDLQCLRLVRPEHCSGQHGDAEIGSHHLAHRIEATDLYSYPHRRAAFFCGSGREFQQRTTPVQSDKIVRQAFREPHARATPQRMPLRTDRNQLVFLKRFNLQVASRRVLGKYSNVCNTFHYCPHDVAAQLLLQLDANLRVSSHERGQAIRQEFRQRGHVRPQVNVAAGPLRVIANLAAELFESLE